MDDPSSNFANQSVSILGRVVKWCFCCDRVETCLPWPSSS